MGIFKRWGENASGDANRRKTSRHSSSMEILMKSSWKLAALSGLTVFFLASCARPSPERLSGWVSKKIEKELKVTADQKAGLETLRRDAVRHWNSMAEQRRLVNLEIDRQLRAPKGDPEAVKKTMAEAARVDQAEQLALVDRTAAWVDSLSPAQRVKLADLHKKMSHRAFH